MRTTKQQTEEATRKVCLFANSCNMQVDGRREDLFVNGQFLDPCDAYNFYEDSRQYACPKIRINNLDAKLLSRIAEEQR